ncbi:transcriptional regulator with XRE-family HTH domain [Oxalobacteraceae bacterium GrIS 1.11]
MNTFALRLLDALKRTNGGNKSELARFLKVTPQAVQKWCGGEGEPRGQNLLNTAIYLSVTPEYLKFGIGAETAAVVAPPPSPPPLPEPELIYAYPDEMKIITAYRESTDKGKHQMLVSSEMTEKKPAALLPAKLLLRRN